MSFRDMTPDFLTQREMKALLVKAKESDARSYAMILLCYRHAYRNSELISITLQNIDLQAGNIRCERLKGSISNWQQLARDEVRAIRAYMKKRPECDSKYLFLSNRKKPMTRAMFGRIFKKLALSAGIPEEKCHPHILKHSIASHLSAAGISVQVIQQRLGHKSIQNTMVYTSVANPFVDRAFASAMAQGAVV